MAPEEPRLCIQCQYPIDPTAFMVDQNGDEVCMDCWGSSDDDIEED